MDIHGSLKSLDFIVIGLNVLAVLGLGFWVSFQKNIRVTYFLPGGNYTS